MANIAQTTNISQHKAANLMIERHMRQKGKNKSPRVYLFFMFVILPLFDEYSYNLYEMVRVKQKKKSLGQVQWLSAQIIQRQQHYWTTETDIQFKIIFLNYFFDYF
jgi:hypothetical protein